MKKIPLFGSLAALLAVLIIPTTLQAGATISSVSLNGNTSGQTQVDPGDNITVVVTTTLTNGEKWKGTNWGINNFGITPTCVNSKNAKEGTRNIQNGVYSETFTIKAPAYPGLYDANFLVDGKNNCGQPVGSVYTASQRIRVGIDAEPPVIAAHSDILVVSTVPLAVSYTAPAAIDNIDPVVTVNCLPASGSVFSPGDTLVTCTASDSSGNQAVPSTFKITLAPPPDTIAPVIATHGDISVAGTVSGAVVSYTNPTATDNVDASVTVACTPASGSNFSVGTTTVTCTAQDAAGNNAIPSTFAVGVYVPVPTDTVAPVIATHENISVASEHINTPAVVTYTLPTGSDNVDASVVVSCLPASGTSFAFGTTTVTCTAQDAAGNSAIPVTFDVGVYFIPQPYVMTEQNDESFLCTPNWRDCFNAAGGSAVINLGLGSTLGGGSLKSVTIAKDASSPFVSQPWIIEIRCYTDSAYTTLCSDWVAPNSYNGFFTYSVSEFGTETLDNKYWTADFTNSSHHANIDGSSPVVFKPSYYYQLQINDNGWSIGAWGSESLALPYYVINGMTR